jgi:hypothetical protein
MSTSTTASLSTGADITAPPTDHLCVRAPVAIPALRELGLTCIGAGMNHSAALRSNGQMLTFGLNQSGQLGISVGVGGGSNCKGGKSAAAQDEFPRLPAHGENAEGADDRESSWLCASLSSSANANNDDDNDEWEGEEQVPSPTLV